MLTIQPAQLLKHPSTERPTRMPNDLLVAEMTWGSLEEEWLRLASPRNVHLVPDLVTFLWKESGYLPEQHTFHRILAATIILAGPAYEPGSKEGPTTPT